MEEALAARLLLDGGGGGSSGSSGDEGGGGPAARPRARAALPLDAVLEALEGHDFLSTPTRQRKASRGGVAAQPLYEFDQNTARWRSSPACRCAQRKEAERARVRGGPSCALVPRLCAPTRQTYLGYPTSGPPAGRGRASRCTARVCRGEGAFAAFACPLARSRPAPSVAAQAFPCPRRRAQGRAPSKGGGGGGGSRCGARPGAAGPAR